MNEELGMIYDEQFEDLRIGYVLTICFPLALVL